MSDYARVMPSKMDLAVICPGSLQLQEISTGATAFGFAWFYGYREAEARAREWFESNKDKHRYALTIGFWYDGVREVAI